MLNFSFLHLNSTSPKDFFIKDPIHETINFPIDNYWIYKLVNTYEIQRLSKFRQLALSYLNFPSATHTRYSHSLGVYELCNRFIKHFLENKYLTLEKDQIPINIALACSLLHDVGHGPLSHVFEKIFPWFNHEKTTLRLIESPETKINQILREKAKEDNLPTTFYVDEIKKVFSGTSKYLWIMDLISSDIDIDRLDFLVRDSHFSGVSYGKTIDIQILIKWSVIKENRLLFSSKAKNHISHFWLARKHMYEDLYHNKVSVVYEEILIQIFNHFKANKNKYLENPYFQEFAFLFEEGANFSLSKFLSLSDDNFLHSIKKSLEFSNLLEAQEYLKLFFGQGNDTSVSEYMEKTSISEKDKKFNLSIDLLDVQTGSLVRWVV